MDRKNNDDDGCRNPENFSLGNNISDKKSCDSSESEAFLNQTDQREPIKEFNNFSVSLANENLKFPSGFSKIRNSICLYFFELLKENEIEASKLVLQLREDIIVNKNFIFKKIIYSPILKEMATNCPNIFNKYFSDLVKIVRQLIIFSKVYKKIGAFLLVKPIADYLEENDINLLHSSEGFYRSIKEIYDLLKENYFDFFPNRETPKEEDSQGKSYHKIYYEYRKIVASKLKIYAIKHIYNGKYKEIKCPKCLIEGFITNTDVSRLDALEFHHKGDEKSIKLTADHLFHIFNEDRSNPNVLEKIIVILESEEVELLCSCHHFVLHDNYYLYFNYLINYENICSLPVEIIYTLILVSLDNFYLTKHLDFESKKNIKRKIIEKLKKKLIFELFFGEFCPTCGEFSIKKHLPAFQFNHFNEEAKTLNASDLYKNYSCSEIIQILIQEKGGYICANCHSVIHYKYINLLDKIYNDKQMIKKVIEDYNNVVNNFTLMDNDKELINDPFDKDTSIYRSLVNYLTAIYEISNSKNYVSTQDLMDYLNITYSGIYDFFNRNDAIKKYVSIKFEDSDFKKKLFSKNTQYFLNSEGEMFMSLINHFKNFYSSFK